MVERLVVGCWSLVVAEQPSARARARSAINKNQPQHAWGAAPIVHPPHLARLGGRLAERADPSFPLLALIGAIGKFGRVSWVIITKSFQIRGPESARAGAKLVSARWELVVREVWREEGKERRGREGCWREPK
ncbi:hypothetical protein N431DRAFT_55224 [Stipitochalara longipes BDJ]|nr:hypothetical protein N431DRAFT_55224 [Stipitochalara longipes BDJ]